MKQRVMIETLTAGNMPLIDVHWQIKAVHQESCADTSTGQCWAAGVCDGKLEQLSLKESQTM